MSCYLFYSFNKYRASLSLHSNEAAIPPVLFPPRSPSNDARYRHFLASVGPEPMAASPPSSLASTVTAAAGFDIASSARGPHRMPRPATFWRSSSWSLLFSTFHVANPKHKRCQQTIGGILCWFRRNNVDSYWLVFGRKGQNDHSLKTIQHQRKQ